MRRCYSYILSLALAGCATAETIEEPAESSTVRARIFTGPPADPQAQSFVAFVERSGDDYVLAGDMLIAPDRVELDDVDANPDDDIAHAGVRFTALWPNRRVPIEIAADVPDHERIWTAINILQNASGVRFVGRTTEADYIRVIRHSACSATLGHVGNMQNVRLADNCGWSSTLHELMHSLGFHHEQCRRDRDDHVVIHWDNIVAGQESNFQMYAVGSGVDSGVYDYDSRMHYRASDYAEPHKLTITRRHGSGDILTQFSDDTLSQGDITALFRMYGHRVTHPIDNRVCGGAGRYKYTFVPPGTPYAHVQQVVRLYCAAFDRVPDPSGFQYWVGQRNAGMSVETIATNLAGSPEFVNRYGQVTLGEFATLMYRLVLDRDPDPDGYGFWVRGLLWGRTRGWMLGAFSESPEYKTRTSSII